MASFGSLCAWAGPVEFGLAEVHAAAEARGIAIRIETELNLDPPNAYRIVVLRSGHARVSGGDITGLMYGLLAAAGQLRSDGEFKPVRTRAQLSIRGIRLGLDAVQVADPNTFAPELWRARFEALARARINRVILSMPVEAWRVDRLCFLSQTANEFGVDLGISAPSDASNQSRVYELLRAALGSCVLIRLVEWDAGEEPLERLQTGVLQVLKDTGHRVALDLHGTGGRPELAAAAMEAGIPVDLAADADAAPTGAGLHAVVAAPLSMDDPAALRAWLATLVQDGLQGFELNLLDWKPNPEAQETFPSVLNLWGMLGYDPGPVGDGAPPAR